MAQKPTPDQTFISHGAINRFLLAVNEASLLAAETAFSMSSLLASAFGLWALTAQMKWTSGFLFSSGPLGHWAVWLAAVAISMVFRNRVRRAISSMDEHGVEPVRFTAAEPARHCPE